MILAKSREFLCDNGAFKDITVNSGAFKDITVDNGTFKNITIDNYEFKDINADNGTFKDINADDGTFKNLDMILAKSREFLCDNGSFKNISTDDIRVKNITVVSDRRYKNDISYNNISSDQLDNLNMVSFKYNGDNDDHIGFIAQEIEEYYPQLIKKDSNGYLSVKYLEMIPLLLDYNQKLKNKLVNIETKINSL